MNTNGRFTESGYRSNAEQPTYSASPVSKDAQQTPSLLSGGSMEKTSEGLFIFSAICLLCGAIAALWFIFFGLGAFIADHF